jgi:hypothetical protein
MRMSLVAMLLIGAVFGLLGRELVRLRGLAAKQRKSIAQLEKKGARFVLQLDGVLIHRS